MNQANKRPVTHRQAADVPWPDVLVRWQELSGRDATSGAIARLQATGTHDPARHPAPSQYPPLTVAEHLEMLALGERAARYFRHPSHTHRAVLAGASWPQIASAVGMKSLPVRQDYADWADAQRALTEHGMTSGLSEAEHTMAIAAAACPPCPRCGSGEVAWDGNDETSESWHCCTCHTGYVTGGAR